MRGRKKESVEILEFKGKSHKTKKELEERSKRFFLGQQVFIEPDYVAEDYVAHQKWVWLIDLYSKSKHFKNHITTANTDQLATYCILYSSQVSIINSLKTAKGLEKSSFSNSLIKISSELNKLGKDLLLDYFSAAKVQVKEEPQKEDPLQKAGFNI